MTGLDHPASVSQPQMPWKVRAINRVGPTVAKLPFAGRASSLSVDSMLAEARQRAGFEDFGNHEFIPALQVLVQALEREAHLSFHGRVGTRKSLVSSLIQRLRMTAFMAKEPAVLAVPIERPVFIIGLMRTGSTLLHHLLAQHPNLRVPRLWELGTPVSLPDVDTEEALTRSTQAYVDEYFYLAPRLKSIHFIDARRPDECHRLLGNSFESMVFEMRYEVPSYGAWLARRDGSSAYREHRLQLQHILHRRPGSPVVLKCPFHLWKLPSLLEVYPDARVIHLHRNLETVLASTCSLSAVIRAARSERVDMAAIGRTWLDHTATAVANLHMPAFQRSAFPKAEFLDVDYSDLTQRRHETLGRVCEFIGVSYSKEIQARFERWQVDNPPGKHGRHDYRLEQFAIAPGALQHAIDQRVETSARPRAGSREFAGRPS